MKDNNKKSKSFKFLISIFVFAMVLASGLLAGGKNVSAGGGLGGLLPGDPISAFIADALGFDDLFCSLDPLETAVYSALGWDICEEDGGGGGSTCICSSAQDADNCLGLTYSNPCGKSCTGTKTADCSDAGSHCSGVSYSSSNGCGSCIGTKISLDYTYACIFSEVNNCDNSNCKEETVSATARCVRTDGCGNIAAVGLSECVTNGVPCANQTIICPACPWRETKP